VTIAGDRAVNLDLCLALTAFSCEGSFTCTHLLRHGTSVFKVIFERLVILPSECGPLGDLLAKEQSLPILNVLGLTRPAPAGLEFTIYRLLSESTTTRLRQPVDDINFK
jgi:hypothetical protein